MDTDMDSDMDTDTDTDTGEYNVYVMVNLPKGFQDQPGRLEMSYLPNEYIETEPVLTAFEVSNPEIVPYVPFEIDASQGGLVGDYYIGIKLFVETDAGVGENLTPGRDWIWISSNYWFGYSPIELGMIYLYPYEEDY
jgi:hypothetical protein